MVSELERGVQFWITELGEAVLSCYAVLGQHWTHCRADKSTSIENTTKTDCCINLLYKPSFKEHNGQHTNILCHSLRISFSIKNNNLEVL